MSLLKTVCHPGWLWCDLWHHDMASGLVQAVVMFVMLLHWYRVILINQVLFNNLAVYTLGLTEVCLLILVVLKGNVTKEYMRDSGPVIKNYLAQVMWVQSWSGTWSLSPCILSCEQLSLCAATRVHTAQNERSHMRQQDL